MKAIVVGSTGGVGRWIVHTLACDPRIEVVTALTRRNGLTADFFHLKSQTNQFAKVVQKTVNFVHLDEALFKGYDIGFSALGIYTGQAKNEKHFREIEIDYNLRAAKAMYDSGKGVKRFAYLSGAGASQTGSFIMFARVKGAAELALQSVGFERATVVRPGGIYNRGDDAVIPVWYYRFNEVLNRMLPGRFSVDAQDIAKAMVHSTLKPAEMGIDMSKMIYENMRIRLEASAYAKENSFL